MKDYSSLLTDFFKDKGIKLWGEADLKEFDTPADEAGHGYDFAISFAVPMNPEIMEGIKDGPNQLYADEYARVNALINAISGDLVVNIKKIGKIALALPASKRTDEKLITGVFPHKTAATRSGLGWIGKNCQLITRTYGPWVRLGTVFTDMKLDCATPVGKEFCGKCRKCVEACPADALKGNAWAPGIMREEILDVFACDRWKKENYMQFHRGHNCGICSSVCPYGVRSLKSRNP